MPGRKIKSHEPRERVPIKAAGFKAAFGRPRHGATIPSQGGEQQVIIAQQPGNASHAAPLPAPLKDLNL